MITLSDPRDQDLVLEAIADPEGYALGLKLTIEGEDYGERFVEGVWGQSNIPITLDGTISGHLPRRLDGGEVELTITVEGVVVPQLISSKMEFLPGEELGLTDTLASTPGAYFFGDDAIRVGGTGRSYPGVSPQNIVRDAALHLPYEPSLVRVDEVAGLALDFSETGDVPGFLPEESWGDVISMVEDRAGYRYADTPYKGFWGYIPVPLARGQVVPEARAYRASDMPDWIPPARSSLRFYDVRVFRYNADGSLAFEFIERIPHRGVVNPPHPGQTLNIVLEATADFSSAYARTRVVREAIEQGRALYSGQVTLPAFDPLIQVEDRFSVYERVEDDDGLFERLWLAKVASYANPYGSETTTQSTTDNVENILGRGSNHTGGVVASTVGYWATILEEERVRVPSFIVPASASDTVASGVLHATGGSLEGLAYWVAGDHINFDLEACPWLSIEGDDLVFTTEAPITIDGDEWVIEEEEA